MERREHYNEQPDLDGAMSMEFDIACGRIRSVADGFWSMRQTIGFFEDWKQIIKRVHAAGHSVSAFVDMSASNVQRAEVIDVVAAATSGLYRPGDAVAMLMPNSLTKMQMRRILDPGVHNFFLSPTAAETWLRGWQLKNGGHLRVAGGW